MNPQNISSRKFAVFMLISFLAAYIPIVLAGFMYAKGNTILFMLLFRIVAVAFPFLAVIIARLPLKKIGFGLKCRFKYIIAALIGLQILSWIGAAIYFIIFPGSFKLGFDAFTAMLPSDLASVFDSIDPFVYLVVMTIMSLTIIPVSQIIPSLGEEAGWRGVMYPFLKNKLGKTIGRILGGALWGIWHWPLVIIGGYFYGREYPGYPVLGPIVICISLILFGIVIDYLYEKTNSIWVASVAHAAMNAASMPMLLISGSSDSNMAVFGPTGFALIPLIPVLIAAVILSLKKETIKEAK